MLSDDIILMGVGALALAILIPLVQQAFRLLGGHARRLVIALRTVQRPIRQPTYRPARVRQEPSEVL